MEASSVSVTPGGDNASDGDYYELERRVAARVAGLEGPLFTTDAAGLFDAYLAGLPAGVRQHYNCNACRAFVERYGGLVALSEVGFQRPALWGPPHDVAPPLFANALNRLRCVLASARVTGVFLSNEKVWGRPETDGESGRWTHLSGKPRAPFSHALYNAEQAMAQKREDHGTLCRGLAEFTPAAALQAVRVLEAPGALERSEKALGVARWLCELYARLDACGGDRRRRDNVLWHAAATAPPGYCHPKSTMIGTLLEDIAAGMGFEAVAARWAKKMHPLAYQRPQTLTEGQVAAATKVVERLGSAGALARRFARLDEIRPYLYWAPRELPVGPAKAAAGPFDHLLPQKSQVKPLELPPVKMTWARFRSEVLPGAATLELYVTAALQPFYGLVTAVDPGAPPLLQWDGLAGRPRNPFSWYFKAYGSTAGEWSLTPNSWAPVRGVCAKPNHWQEPGKFAHHGEGAFLALAGCRPAAGQVGGGLFVSFLRADYHDAKNAIEAHAKRAAVAGHEEADANGYAIESGGTFHCTLRVRSAAGEATYVIDRWE